jgi:uncharacterized protein (DUF1501 family)
MLSRRKFVKLSGLGAVIAMAYASVPIFVSKAFAATQPGAATAGGQRALVLIELSGGNDGLNTVVPFEDARYYNLRPNIAIPAKDVLKLQDGIGLHPTMSALHGLYQSGRVAIVQGVGYPNPNYSHFESADIWYSAQPSKGADRTGWVGRYLENSPATKAANFSGDNPLALYTQTTIVPAFNGLDEFYFQPSNYYNDDAQARYDTARRIFQQAESNPLAEYIRSSAFDAITTAEIIQRNVRETGRTPGYPESDLGNQLEAVSQLLKANLDFRVFYLRLSGFDTHSNQPDQQAQLLQDVSDSLAAFYNDLRQAGLAGNVTAMTFSEFGRRPAENGGGTDHGSAQPVFVVGDSVRGGLYGTAPSLDNLDDENLRFGLDFRQVYASVLDGWLGLDPAKILDQTWPTLPLF